MFEIISHKRGERMRKILFAFGLLWILLWCIVGIYLGIQHESYIKDMEKFAQANDLSKFWDTQNAWKTKTSSHSHALCLSFLLLLMTLILPYMGLSDKLKNILGVILIVGVVLASVFEWFAVIPLMVIGELLVIIAIVISLIGVIKRVEEK